MAVPTMEETEEIKQKTIQKEMIYHYGQHGPYGTSQEDNMNKCFWLIRQDINMIKNPEELSHLFINWPFLANVEYLITHFKKLTGKNKTIKILITSCI